MEKMQSFDFSRPILVVPYTHTLSHLSRPLEIAKKLRDMGYTLIFAGESAKIEIIKAEGFEVFALFEPDPDELYGNIRDGKLRFCDRETLTKMVEEELKLYRICNPCLVVSDGRFSAPISCQYYSVKHAAIVNASSTQYRSIPYFPLFEWLWINKFFPFFKKHILNFNLAIEKLIFDSTMNTFSKLTKQYKLTNKVTATNCLTGVDLTLLADLPEYFPIKDAPENYHFIGPITWKRSDLVPVPSWWPIENQSHKKIIYMTMGTTGESKLFDIILNQLKLSEYITIITTGGTTDLIHSNNGNIFIEKYLDGDMVMEISDAVICHGGNGTIYQALSYGKPIIGIPTIPDQSFNMRRVEAFQIGKTISIDQIMSRPQIILHTLEKILDKKELYHSNAIRFQNKLQQYDGARTGANIVARFIQDNIR